MAKIEVRQPPGYDASGSALVPKSLYDANSILAATVDDTPAVLALAASTFVGRKATGGPAAMSVDEVVALLQDTLMRWTVDIDVFQTSVSQTNWSTLQFSTSYVYGTRRASSGAQNAEVNFDVVLSAGTWDIEVQAGYNTNAGIITVQLDGVTVGTLDTYNGSATNNNAAIVSGVSVAVAGKKRLKLLMATKNASSSSYFGLLHHIQLRRTA